MDINIPVGAQAGFYMVEDNIGGALGAIAGNVWSKRMEEKRAAMQQATQGTGIEVSRTPNEELRVNVPADFSFDVGRADIKPQMRPVLGQFARAGR